MASAPGFNAVQFTRTSAPLWNRGRRSTSRRGSCIVTLLVIGLILIIAGLVRGCSEGALTPVNPLRGSDWTVGGVTLGDTVDDVIRRLGPVDRTEGDSSDQTLSFRNGETLLHADAARRVTYIWSKVLLQNSKPVLSEGLAEGEVTTVLGPTQARMHYRPKGSGIISVGGVHDSTTFTYQWGSAIIEVYVYEGTVRCVEGKPAPPPGSRH